MSNTIILFQDMSDDDHHLVWAELKKLDISFITLTKNDHPVRFDPQMIDNHQNFNRLADGVQTVLNIVEG
jgi:hypothetical protein